MTTINSLFELVKRNTKLFYKQKMTVVFSLMAPVLLFAIYRLFMHNVLPGFMEDILVDMDVPPPDSLISGVASAWMMAGVVTMSCFSISINTANVMVKDKDQKIIDDFTASPFRPQLFILSYFFSSFIITFVLSTVILSLGVFYLTVVTSIVISFVGFLTLVGVLFISCLSIVMMVMCIMSFFTSSSTTAAFNGIFSALIGFFIAAFLPHGMLPPSVQTISGLIPGTHSATLLRNVMLRTSRAQIASYLYYYPELYLQLSDTMSFNLYVFGINFSFTSMMMYVVGSIFVFFGLFVLINGVLKRGKK